MLNKGNTLEIIKKCVLEINLKAENNKNKKKTSGQILKLKWLVHFLYRYMKAAKVGDEIVIDAKTLKLGSRLAFLTVDITKKSDGSLLAQGKHTKYIGQ